MSLSFRDTVAFFHFDGVILLAAREGWRLLFFVACIIAIGVVTSPSSRMACVACG